ncbi:hypothetical protein EDD18DRAFT_611056 [Armillaria luteobubalina]|uniref:Uncharacterized protein n=1 Tax=Armillaria luteobubalina TaxID=153913 RepID=A0AA39QJ01_9AGAR|nr:hypothetical protein EDD18DRAFT_611056 [Armillaria luteobubalina]
MHAFAYKFYALSSWLGYATEMQMNFASRQTVKQYSIFLIPHKIRALQNVPNIVHSAVAISSSTLRRLDLRFSPSFPSHAHSRPHMSVLPIPIKDAAVQNNQRIFSTYETSLSDATHYIEYAGKFASWLDSDRAYYPLGKPSIVSILMTAYRTVHGTICPRHDINNATLLNTDPYKNHPLMFAYRHLIEVLSKYVKHFVDDAVLRPQVQFLLHTVGMQLNPDTRPHISSTTFSERPASSCARSNRATVTHSIVSGATESSQEKEEEF